MRERTMLFSKVNKECKQAKSLHPLSAFVVEISSPRKPRGRGFLIFVPVPSKNFPSGLVPWRLSSVQTTSDPQTVPLPSFFSNIFHIWNIILWSWDIKKLSSLRNILLFSFFVAPKILSSIVIHHCLHFTAATKIYPEFLKSHVIF